MAKQIGLYEWLDYWREMYYRATVGESTYKINGFNLRIIKNHLPDRPLEDVTKLDCQRLLNDMHDEKYAKATIKKIITILRNSFAQAVMDRVIEETPMKDYTIPKAHTKKVNALKQKQQIVLEAYCNDLLYGEYMIFLLDTGLRVSEMTSLQWPDFDSLEKIIYIRMAKTESGIRELMLTDRAYEIIMAQKKSDRDNYIFRNLHDNPISYSSMKKCYEKLRQKTGYLDFTNHVCRHSFATRLAERGARPKGIAALLGHKKAEYAINIYEDVERESLKKDVYLLNQCEQADTSDIALAMCIRFISQYGGAIPPEIENIIEKTGYEVQREAKQ